MALYDEVLRYLGYRGQEIDTELDTKLNKYIDLVNQKIKPSFIYRIFDIEISDKVSLINTNVNFTGSDIINHFNGASKCVVMAATLGLESERVLSYLSKIKLAEAVIFDAVCTAKIEEVCDKCESEVEKWAEENSYFTNFRYSPGYGDFPLEHQRQIVNLLSCEKSIGLTVTDSSLLIPQKSVTAVIGVFEDKQKEQKHNCETCSLKDKCMFRKNGCIKE